jgi:mannose-6-phosphate isomerase-like protein (cupin superfamily)
MAEEPLEFIVSGLEPIALIIRARYAEPGLHFFTPPSFSQQLAFMLHPAGKIIEPHVHNPVSRHVLYTQEVLVIRNGRVRCDLFTSGREYHTSRILADGDVILLCGGGHSLEFLEETGLIEIKQGPYAGDGDKTRFEGEVRWPPSR